MFAISAGLSTCQEIVQPGVGEGTTHHHLMVGTVRPVGIDFRVFNPFAGQVLPGRAGGSDLPGRGNVVGGD